MDGAVCLIVNPHAGGGRAARLLPGVEAALRGHGRRFRVERTTSMEHARELAREARDAGEIVAAMGGDGLTGAVAGELRDGDGRCSPSCPAAAATTSRASSASRTTRPTRSTLLARGERAADRRRRGRRDDATSGILAPGFDSDVSRIAIETRLQLGTFVYIYGALRALAALEARRAGRSTSTASRARFTGYSVAVATPACSAAGCTSRPDAELDDGLLDVVLTADQSKLRYLRGLPRVFKGTHVEDPASTFLQGREVTFRPTGRSPPTPTATRSPTCRRPSRRCPARCGCWCR